MEECQVAPDPWDRASAIRNQVLMFLPMPIGAYAIARFKPRKLPAYISGVIAFFTVYRHFTCARCQYYGRECSTMLGIMTARMMPRDEKKPLDRSGMIADLSLLGALAMVPIPQVFRKPWLALLYLASLGAGTGAMLFTACGRCRNDFCIMKDVHRAATGGGRTKVVGHLIPEVSTRFLSHAQPCCRSKGWDLHQALTRAPGTSVRTALPFSPPEPDVMSFGVF
jgi:hypothetical protein